MRDENYITLTPPEGFCVNRYCESGPTHHDVLVRGYCAPCASIRKPHTGTDPSYVMDYSRVAWGSLSGVDRDTDRY